MLILLFSFVSIIINSPTLSVSFSITATKNIASHKYLHYGYIVLQIL